ncbi:MAG: ComEC/Rec2 family competence protein [Clostridia bacterium]|nr:ComEC/Rec2 family competence protein [Clostridia bacterium]
MRGLLTSPPYIEMERVELQKSPLFHKRLSLFMAVGTLIGVCAAAVESDVFSIVAMALCAAGFVLFSSRYLHLSLMCLLALLMIGLQYALGGRSFDFENSSLYGWTLGLREGMEAKIDLLFDDYNGLIKGLLLGDKYGISQELYSVYVNNGVAHLFAVSGLHISILSGFVLRLFRPVAQWLRATVLVAFLAIYVCLTGLSPSAMRAAVMLLVILSAKLVKGRPDYLSAFSIAMTVVLFVSPSAIQRSSFLLSFGCVYGILMLSDPLKKFLRMPKGMVSSLLITGVVVNFAVLPWSAKFFGGISLTAIPISILVLPLSSILIISSFVAVVVSYIFQPLAAVIAYLPKGLLFCINHLLNWANVGLFSLKAPNDISTALWFVSIFFLSKYYLPNRTKFPIIGVLLLAASILLWILI